MAYVRYDALANQVAQGSLTLDGKLHYCTETEMNESVSFYGEDLIRVSNQQGFHSMMKVMAVFWGVRKQVWVGFDESDTVLTRAVALSCPPYYPPYSAEGVDISDEPIPEGFPPPP
jgi:hypothetical protein